MNLTEPGASDDVLPESDDDVVRASMNEGPERKEPESPALVSDAIERARNGDADAFATLFHAHKSRIFYLCLRMTANVAEAEDLTQDTFVQVFRKIGTFRGDSAFSTWIHRIAVNTVLMRFRKKSLPQVSLDEEYSNSDGAKTRREYGTKDARLTGCIDRVALASAIKELPRGYRTIFQLHQVEGYEHREIAEMLGCSVGNSKSQLYKAKLRIREWLARSPEGPVTLQEEKSRTKPRRPTFENWNLSIRQDVGVQTTSGILSN